MIGWQVYTPHPGLRECQASTLPTKSQPASASNPELLGYLLKEPASLLFIGAVVFLSICSTEKFDFPLSESSPHLVGVWYPEARLSSAGVWARCPRGREELPPPICKAPYLNTASFRIMANSATTSSAVEKTRVAGGPAFLPPRG